MESYYSENTYILKRKNDNDHILVEKINEKYLIIKDINNINGKLFAIHKKDEKILNAYLKNNNVKIEWYTNYGDYPYIWDDYYLNFLENYDEQETYRLKIL